MKLKTSLIIGGAVAAVALTVVVVSGVLANRKELPKESSSKPKDSAPVDDAPKGASVYEAQRGDTLGKIVDHFGLTMSEVLAWNPEITDPNRIKRGQRIRLNSVVV
jgi:LysM repeat protein